MLFLLLLFLATLYFNIFISYPTRIESANKFVLLSL